MDVEMMEIGVQPWITEDGGRGGLAVAERDMWNPSPGFGAAYLVDCERLNEAPVRRVET